MARQTPASGRSYIRRIAFYARQMTTDQAKAMAVAVRDHPVINSCSFHSVGRLYENPMPNAENVAHQIAVHEVVYSERWKHVNSQLGRIEAVFAVIVLLFLIGERSVTDVLKRVLGG